MREPLIASKGHILTDGETYCNRIYLAEGMNASAFYEITVAEHEALTQEQEPEQE